MAHYSGARSFAVNQEREKMACTPKVGDLVRRVRGKSPIRITHLYLTGAIDGVYVNSGISLYLYSYEYVPYNPDQQPNQKENIMQLYEIKHGEAATFGTKLAVNSEKKWVMEEKGTGAVFVVDPANVKKVMPYTITVLYAEGTQQFLADKGLFNKGEFYLVQEGNELHVARVTAVDTESEKATKEFKPLGRLNVELM